MQTRRSLASLGSRALHADSFQTSACFWLSIVSLAGVALNAAFGWWWADPVAALGIVLLLVKEGREGLRGESCCDVDLNSHTQQDDHCCETGEYH